MYELEEKRLKLNEQCLHVRKLEKEFKNKTKEFCNGGGACMGLILTQITIISYRQNLKVMY